MNSWKEFIATESSKEYYIKLKQIIDKAYETKWFIRLRNTFTTLLNIAR